MLTIRVIVRTIIPLVLVSVCLVVNRITMTTTNNIDSNSSQSRGNLDNRNSNVGIKRNSNNSSRDVSTSYSVLFFLSFLIALLFDDDGQKHL